MIERNIGRFRLRAFCLLLAAVWSPVSGAVNPTLQAIPANTWLRITAPAEFSDGTPVDSGIVAFSGMAYDDVHQKILVFGGGHKDYWGNEIWAFDPETLSWTPMYEPDPIPDVLTSASFQSAYPGAVFYPPGEPLSEARPLSRHTYDTVEFISSLGVLFTTGKYTWGNGESTRPYCWGCDDTWTYNLATNKWTYRNLAKDPVPDGIAAAAYDPITDLVYVISQTETWTYDGGTDHWAQLSTTGTPPTSIEEVAEYDSKRQVIYLLGGEFPSHNELWRYDIGTNTWSNLNPSGDLPPATGGYGLAYDKANDVLVAWHGGGVGTYAYDPSTNSWRKQNPVGGEPDLANRSKRVHGNLKYDPVNNVALLVGANSGATIEVWAYRYGNAVLDTTSPSVPGGLTATAINDAGIHLAWSAASDPESGVTTYRVYRDGVLVGSSALTSYDDTGLSEGASYSYQVSAVNGVGLESTKSGSASATTLADTTSPGIAGVGAASANQVIVEFTEPVELASAELGSNYALSGGATVLTALLLGDLKSVRLTTSELASGQSYTLTVNNVLDRASSPNTIPADSEATFTYTAGTAGSLLVSDVNPSDYTWAVLTNGEQTYVDRSITFSSVPADYSGLDFLQTANNDKSLSGADQVSFNVSDPVDVYVAYDTRPDTPPAWLSDWEDTGDELSTTDASLHLYRKAFPAGQVTLGGNQPTVGNDYSMYSVVVAVSNSNATGTGGTGSNTSSGAGGVSAGVGGSSGSGGGGMVGFWWLAALLLLLRLRLRPMTNRK